jgi:subtilase family serine protease
MSIARDSINSDANWRITDSTANLGEESYNIDHSKLATAGVGLNVFRDVRLSYYVGLDYIGTINSTVARIAMAYQLSSQYTFITVQAYDLSASKSEESAITILRHFDRFYASLTVFYNDISRQSGFQFGFIPEGLGRGVNTDVLQKYLDR